MSFISLAYLTMVIVSFLTFGVSLFSVHLYVNAKGADRKTAKAQAASSRTDDAEEFRRAA